MVAPSARFDSPPFPHGLADAARWEEGRRRRRLLSGNWAPDLERKLRQHFGITRRIIMGAKSLAKNRFRKLCQELAVNYHKAPLARHATGELDTMFGRTGLVTRVGLWPLMRRVQVELIGLRQMALRPSWSPELDMPVMRKVTPDVLLGKSFASAPNIPVEMRELRWRDLSDGRGVWAWDVVSIADATRPIYKVVVAQGDGQDGEDITRLVLGATFEGDAYPYRWTQGARTGKPFLPYVMYHAMRKECLWDPNEGIEVVEGSLDVASAYTFLQHVIFRASWPQRYGLGVYVAGAAPKNTAAGPRSEVPTDPTSFLHLEGDPNVPNPVIGQWGAGCDPEMLARVVGMLERGVSDFDGLDLSHIAVRDAANPTSAEALSITREGKREAQSRYREELMPSDLEALEKLAAVWNIESGEAPMPESDYLVDYQAIPLSAAEMEARRVYNGELIAQGRMSIVEAYRSEHPGVTDAEARAALRTIEADNREFGVVAGTAPSAMRAGAAADQPKSGAPAPAGA